LINFISDVNETEGGIVSADDGAAEQASFFGLVCETRS
jgi:hypothetical protein